MTSATTTNRTSVVRLGQADWSWALEAIVVLAALIGLSIALLGAPLWHAGLYTDDWSFAQIYAQSGVAGVIHAAFYGDHSRPLTAVYLGLAEWVVGSNAHWHAAFGLATHVLGCGAIYWLLRRWGMRWWEAGLVTLLFLLYPYSDSTWLWFAITQSSISTALAAAGLVTLKSAFGARAARARALQALAMVLMAASVLTYESAAALLIVAVIVLALRCARRELGAWRPMVRLMRRAAPRALPCVAGVVLALVIPRLPGLLPGIEPHTGISQSAQIEHAKTIASQSVTLAANSSVPFGSPHRNVVIGAMLIILLISAATWWVAPVGSLLKSGLGRWLAWGVAGVVVIGASYVVFVNTNPGWYEVLAPGSNNRINAVAAIGYCVGVVATAMLVGILATAGKRQSLAAAVAVSLALAVAFGYAIKTRSDISAWDRAGSDQRYQLATLSRSLSKPSPGTTLFVFGGTGYTTPGVFAFRVTWDLDGAAEILWNDPTLHAYPIFDGTVFVCGSARLYPNGFINGNGPAQSAAYGHAIFFDLRTHRHLLIRSARQCDSAQRQFVPGLVTG